MCYSGDNTDLRHTSIIDSGVRLTWQHSWNFKVLISIYDQNACISSSDFEILGKGPDAKRTLPGILVPTTASRPLPPLRRPPRPQVRAIKVVIETARDGVLHAPINIKLCPFLALCPDCNTDCVVARVIKYLHRMSVSSIKSRA